MPSLIGYYVKKYDFLIYLGHFNGIKYRISAVRLDFYFLNVLLFECKLD